MTSILVLTALCSCGDPLRDVARLSDIDVAVQEASAAALPSQEEVDREGFLGTSAATGPVPAAVAAPEPAPARGGFLGRLLKLQPPESQAPAPVEQTSALNPATPETQTNQAPDVDTQPPVKIAALTPDVQTDATPEAPANRGLFGRLKSADKDPEVRSGPDAADVAYGTVLPFGQIARVCEAQRKPLGRRIEKTAARGYALYDSAPGETTPRTFYITGFADKCPRQFTAANALFGSPSTYETIRFSGAGKHLPYGETDAAYDKVKSRVCRSRRSKPCGRKINQIERSTVFVSAYERYNFSKRWKEFLVHDGVTLAAAVKSYD